MVIKPINPYGRSTYTDWRSTAFLTGRRLCAAQPSLGAFGMYHGADYMNSDVTVVGWASSLHATDMPEQSLTAVKLVTITGARRR